MSESNFVSVIGVVQFDPSDATVNGKSVRNVAMRESGLEGRMVSVTLWPNHASVPVSKGDVLLIEGKFERRQSGAKVFNNLSASEVTVLRRASEPKW